MDAEATNPGANGSRRVMVKVDHLSKRYFIGQFTRDTFQHELQSRWAKFRGREDPNRRIDAQDPHEILALDEVSFEVYEGEAFGIIGRNGAGKSTLLKLICEITAPTSGTIDIYGRISSMLEVGTGFDKEMTGRENVYLNGTLLGMSKEEVDAKMADIIAFSEVGEFIDTPVKRYSSGMYSKLAFSVAAHLDNDIMIMDEVLAVGDVGFKEKCLQKIIFEAESGKTVLYVGHNMNYLRRFCTRCMVLDHGRVAFIGDTEDAITFYLDLVEQQEKREEGEDVKNTASTERVSAPAPSPEPAPVPAPAPAPAPAKPSGSSSLFMGVDRDVSDKERSKLLTQHKMHLDRVAYVNRDDITFLRDEPAVMTYTWRVLEDYKALCMRIEVYTKDDALLASFPLYDVGDGVAGEVKQLTVSVDIGCFAPGLYKFKQSFFFRDGEQDVVNTDRVIGLTFERLADDIEFWNPKKMGNVRFTTAKILESSTIG